MLTDLTQFFAEKINTECKLGENEQSYVKLVKISVAQIKFMVLINNGHKLRVVINLENVHHREG